MNLLDYFPGKFTLLLRDRDAYARLFANYFRKDVSSDAKMKSVRRSYKGENKNVLSKKRRKLAHFKFSLYFCAVNGDARGAFPS